MISGLFVRWRSVSTNALFGITKSIIAYCFLIALYRLADSAESIQTYIDYELGAAGSILMTLGIQARSYKKFDTAALLLLGITLFLFEISLLLANCILNWSDTTAVVAFLIVSDRVLDSQLQVERQNNRYDVYNYFDMGNSIAVKIGFLLFASDFNAWVYIACAKSILSVVLIVRHFERESVHESFKQLKDMFSNLQCWLEWYLFDLLNFATMNLDVVVVRLITTDDFVTAYFYVRKFLRLPLVLLNYMADPLYVTVKSIVDQVEARKKVIEIVAPTYLVSVILFYVFVPWFFLSINSEYAGVMGLLLAITSYFALSMRFGDLMVLLFYSQRDRILLRFLGLSGIPIIFVAGDVSNLLIYTLPAVPMVGWMLAAKYVFNVRLAEQIGQLLLVIGGGAIVYFVREGHSLGAGVATAVVFYIIVAAIGLISAWIGFKQLASIIVSEDVET